jgi:DNA-nicking Smr family endonuclease
MARGSSKSGKSGGSGTDEEGPALWKTYTQDIAPIRGKKHSKDAPAAKPPPVKTSQAKTVTPPVIKPVKQAVEKQPAQLDARTEQRLRKGQMPLDGTIDLHGMTQAEAHGKLNGFIKRAYAKKKRCLLVITGKGRTGEGVLRQKLPQWLAIPPFNEIVLKIYPAAIEHGGTGAWYVYLKRQRDY